MNISTYEARIAALEAQLGPGPGPEPTGEVGLTLISMTPNPQTTDDVEMSQAINNVLPHLTPYVPPEGEGDSLVITLANAADAAANYEIQLTPTSGSYAAITDSAGNTSISETPGTTCTATVSVNAADALNNFFMLYAVVDPKNPTTGIVSLNVQVILAGD